MQEENEVNQNIPTTCFVSDPAINARLEKIAPANITDGSLRYGTTPSAYNSVDIPKSEQVDALFADWLPPLFLDDTFHLSLDMHPNTIQALDESVKRRGPINTLVLHVDGTGGSRISPQSYGPAAWSFNVQETHANGVEYCGFMGGIVQTDSTADEFVGAEHGTNATAELTAILYASLYALQRKASHVCIVYDAMYAANMASGDWTPGKNIELVNLTAEVIGLLNNCANLQLRHVYSHLGDPWNELADAGAAAFSLHRIRSRMVLPEILARADLRKLMPWAFLYVLEPDVRT